MSAPLRRVFASLLICVILLAGATLEHAQAGEAGLVIEHGDGNVTYVLIVFPEDQIASIELLRRSGLSLTSVSSGGLGEAICTIENRGCSLSDCRTNLCQTGDPNDPFWKFFRVGSGGGWLMQPLGASATKVRGGEVDLWSWTGGESTMPVIDINRVIEVTAAPADRTAEGVYVAWFDANGNPIDAPSNDADDDNPVVVGIVMLLLIGVIGFLMIKRQRALTGHSGGRR